MANDIIDINVYETTETVAITVQPNLTTINVNSITSVSPVTSVNGQIGDVVIPTPTLDSVLTEGNTSLLDAKVGRIGLRDTAEGDYGYLKFSENVFTISDYNDDTILGVDYNNIIKQNPTTGLSGTLNFTGITTSRVYTLPDENGEIALKSNIPTYTSQLTNNGSNGTNPFITALDIPTSGQAGSLVREVKNMTGATLTKGTVVYISGANGNKALISKAQANAESSSARTFGLLQSDILNNGLGNCVIIGDLSGLNTSAFTEGAQLYLSGTVAGAYTDIKTLAPTHLVYIGKITRSHPTQGQIEVAIQNGYELDEIHDVSIISKTNNDIIQYDSTDSLWKNRSLSNAGIQPALTNPITGTGTTNYLPKFTGTSALSDSSIQDSGSLVTITNPTTIGATGIALGNTALNVRGNIVANSGATVYLTMGTNSGNYPIVQGFGNGLNILTTGSFSAASGRISIEPQANSHIYGWTTGMGVQIWGTTNSERMRLDAAGNLGIGTSSPNVSSILDLTSTTKGFLPPRMTTTQKNAIATPASGLVVYDTTLGKLCVRGASAWETITSI